MRPTSTQSNSMNILVVAIIVMLLLGVSIIIFIVAKNKNTQSYSNSNYTNHSTDATEQNDTNEERTTQVLVSIRDIKNGEKLEPSMFKTEIRPEGMVKDSDFRDFSQINGFFAKTDIAFRETIDESKITKRKPVNPITANIPEGYRAVTINVDVTSSVEGWARAGAFVDIVWNSMVNGKPSAFVIVQNAKILSAERQVEGNPQEGQAPVPSTVTLLLLADDATKIHLAETTGKLSLQLRGDDVENGVETRTSLTIDDLMGKNTNNDGKQKYDAVVKIKNKNGKLEKWGLKDGSLVLIEE